MKTKTIILLHGWGLSAAKFAPLSAELTSRGYRVITPDFPGFGESPLPSKPLYLHDYVVYLDSVIRKNQVKDAVVIAHSFGGRVILRYLVDHPDAPIQAMVLTGVPGFSPVPSLKFAFFVLLAKIGNSIFSLPGLSHIQGKVRALYYYLVGARDFYRAEGVMRQTFKNIVQEHLESAMKSIRIPTLLIWGEHDSIVPVGIAKRMLTVIGGSTLTVVENENHRVPYQAPKIFANRVERFLSGL